MATALPGRPRPPRRLHRHGRRSAAAAGLAVLLLASGCGGSGSADPAASTASDPATASVQPDPAASLAGAATGEDVAGAVGAGTQVAPADNRPVRITIPAIGVDASITKLGLHDDGTIDVPSDPDDVGWVTSTSLPGQQGPAVLAGHVDSLTGPAVFALLSTLEPGEAIIVTLKDGSRSKFVVDGLERYPQNAFPTAEVYGPVPGPALRLITCGGEYDKSRGGYQDNVVVYAT